MKFLVLVILFFFFLNVFSVDLEEKTCSEKGYDSASLLCEICDKMENYVDNQKIIEDCKSCCHQKDLTTKKEYSYAILQVGQYKIQRHPEVQNFIKDNKDVLKNFRIQYARGASPMLKMRKKEGGEIVDIDISQWKNDQIQEFLFEKLIQ